MMMNAKGDRNVYDEGDIGSGNNGDSVDNQDSQGQYEQCRQSEW